ncbi:MAG: hypothetical protein GY759_00135 [Chloroflexi bacterium]|nr:hypothetical protein [Chloroflexota bacterium]
MVWSVAHFDLFPHPNLVCWRHQRNLTLHFTPTHGETQNETKKVLAITSLFVLSLVVFAGAALAQGPDNSNPNDGWLGQMQQWMGPEAWGERCVVVDCQRSRRRQQTGSE